MSYICDVCERPYESLIDRDVHSNQAHGTPPGSTCRPPPASAAKPPEGWIEYCLAHPPFSVEIANEARAELASLRARLADLEMTLRAALREYGIPHFVRRGSGLGLYLGGDPRKHPDWIKLDDDGTGLPILTDAARAALAREGERRE